MTRLSFRRVSGSGQRSGKLTLALAIMKAGCTPTVGLWAMVTLNMSTFSVPSFAVALAHTAALSRPGRAHCGGSTLAGAIGGSALGCGRGMAT